MIRAVLCLLLASGCGLSLAGAGGFDGGGGSGGTGGSSGVGGSGGGGGMGDGGIPDAVIPPACTAHLEVPSGPFFAGDDIPLRVTVDSQLPPATYTWTTSQGSIPADAGASTTLTTTTAGTYLVMVSVAIQPGQGCEDTQAISVAPRDSHYVRLRVTPAGAMPPRQTFAILPSGASQQADLALSDGTTAALSITAAGTSVAGYLRFSDRLTCAPVEVYPTATAAATAHLLPTPFDVLVIPADSQLAPFLYVDQSGPFGMFGVLAGVAVSGQVRLGDGSPLGNAHVELTDGVLPSSIPATRAGDGGFEAHTLATALPLDAIFAPPDASLPLARTSGAPIAALGASPPTLLFTYDPIVPAHVSGSVALPGGGPAAGAHLVFATQQPFARVGQLAVGSAAPIAVGGTARAELVTGPSGGFGPIALPPAVYDVLVEPPTGAAAVARTRTTVDLSRGDASGVVLALAPPVHWTGSITDSGGQPVAAVVRAAERGASALFQTTQPASTFDLLVDPSATYDVEATPDAGSGLARVRATAVVSPTGGSNVLVAAPGVTLSGVVRGGSGNLGGARIEAMLGVDCAYSSVVVADTTTKPDGSYRMVVPVP
jgi:hypothetical protein